MIKTETIILFFFIFVSSLNAQVNSEFVFVKGGRFSMGSTQGQADEQPVHKVRISDFYVSRTEVTNAQYVKFLNAKGNQRQGNTEWIDLGGSWRSYKNPIYEQNGKFFVRKGYENYPVSFVSWWGAEAYCEWKGGRLPTEAEWEYLAKKAFPDSLPLDTLLKVAVVRENSGYMPNPVAQKEPTWPGIYDLFGNMTEWCYDWYDADYYKRSKRKNPLGPENGQMKVIRGGSWETLARSVRVTNRAALGPDNNNITVGFRVVIPTAKWTKFVSNTAVQYGHKDFKKL